MLRFKEGENFKLSTWFPTGCSSKACKMVLLVQPSSAAAERVFFSSFKQFYGAANVVIGGLHRNFYNVSVQQTELTLFLMFDCRIITLE